MPALPHIDDLAAKKLAFWQAWCVAGWQRADHAIWYFMLDFYAAASNLVHNLGIPAPGGVVDDQYGHLPPIVAVPDPSYIV